MILSGHQIRQHLGGNIVIDPFDERESESQQLQPHAAQRADDLRRGRARHGQGQSRAADGGFVLAAGTLGSTEILMRSKGSVRLSQQLGQKFSANGDMLVTAYNLAGPANAVADECVPPEPPSAGGVGRRRIGPTITSMIDLRTGDPKRDLVIQDLAVPGALRRLFEESTTTFDVLNQLGSGDFTWHRSDVAPDDAAINPRAIHNSLILAIDRARRRFR